MSVLELFPKSVTLYPGQEQTFTARSDFSPSCWTEITDGLLQSDYSLRLSFASQPFVQGSGVHQLVGGIGSLKFTITTNCLPTSTGELRWTVFLTGGWEYRVIIKATSVEIRDQANTLINTLTRTIAVGDQFVIEIANTFRLFINNDLQNSVTSFASSVAVPATYTAKLTTPVSVSPATIPAPELSGDWQLRPVVDFVTPAHGSLSTNGPALSTTYSGGTVPGVYSLVGQIDPGADVWFEDAAPTGSTINTAGGTWTFVSTNPTPHSGALCLKSPSAAGVKGYEFTGATTTLQINPGDSLFCWVFLDSGSPPTEVMLQFKATDATSFEHRAYWGANSIGFGTNGTASRRRVGDLPATGQWVRLEVAASLVDLEGRTLNGATFNAFDGITSFDQLGKIPGLHSGSATITIPPLQILGETSRTVQPGATLRPATNYDQSGSPPTWSVVSGAGSFSQGEFTAGTQAGTTVIRATASVGNQIAEISITVPAIITPDYTVAGPLEVIDWNTTIAEIPYFVAVGALVEGTGAVVPGLPPDLQANDIMLLFVESANEVVSAPAGWTAVADSPQGTGTGGSTTATRISVFWKRVSASGEAAPTVADPGDHAIAQILTFRGCISTGNPWDVTSGDTGASSTSVSIPGDTTTVANCLVVLAVANQTDSLTPQASGFANADLANLTARTNVNTDQGNGGGFTVVTGEKAAAGAYGATTATLANASVQGRISVALKPAATTWTATAGSINSSTGQWTAPSGLGQSVRITVTNGTQTVTRDVLIMERFPRTDFNLPWPVDLSKRVLVSESEDGTRTARIKSRARRSFPVNLLVDAVEDLNGAGLDTIRAFWDRNHPGKRFILDDEEDGSRLVVYADSDLRWEYTSAGINIAFRVKEA